jgi:hypothetical protein
VHLGLSWAVEDLGEPRARGLTEAQLGLADLRRVAARILGPDGR